MWGQMGIPAKLVVIALFFMSAWSIGVMIHRLLAYNAAKTQSRAFAPAGAGALREGQLGETIKIPYRFQKSPPAKVVVARPPAFRAHPLSNELPSHDI